MKRSSVTNLRLENNLLTFRLNAPVVIRVEVKKCEQTLLFIARYYWGYMSSEVKVGDLWPPMTYILLSPDDDWSIQLKHWRVIFQAQVGNITSSFMQELTEKPLKKYSDDVKCKLGIITSRSNHLNYFIIVVERWNLVKCKQDKYGIV